MEILGFVALASGTSEKESSPSPAQHSSRPARRILMVEDEQILTADIARLLEPLGYSVVAATPSGEDAINLAGETHPDLLLVDIGLHGGIDGIDAVEKIRQHSDVPVIYLTAYSDEGTIRRAGATGPASYVVKPYEKNQLLEKITAVVPPPVTEPSFDGEETRPPEMPERTEYPPVAFTPATDVFPTARPGEKADEAAGTETGPHWVYRTSAYRPREHILLYRDDDLGAQMQIVTLTSGPRKGHVRQYFFIDGVNRVFFEEEKMLRVLRRLHLSGHRPSRGDWRMAVRRSADDLVAAWQRIAHFLSLL